MTIHIVCSIRAERLSPCPFVPLSHVVRVLAYLRCRNGDTPRRPHRIPSRPGTRPLGCRNTNPLAVGILIPRL